MWVSVAFSMVTCDLYLQFIDLSFSGLHFHYSKITCFKNLVIFYKTPFLKFEINRLISYHIFFLLFSLNHLLQFHCFNQLASLHLHTHLKTPKFLSVYTLSWCRNITSENLHIQYLYIKKKKKQKTNKKTHTRSSNWVRTKSAYSVLFSL